MTRRRLPAALVPLCLALAAAAADLLPIDRLAPKDSWLVMGIDDFAAARERWARLPVTRWWESDGVQKLVKDDLEKSRRQATERLPVSRTYMPTLFVNLVGQKSA